MCGRYLFNDKTNAEMQDLIQDFSKQIQLNLDDLTEVYPGTQAPVLVLEDSLSPTMMKWGYPKYNQKGTVINGKKETVFTNYFFHDSKPCVIPACGFYEWDSNKKKHYIQDQNKHILYMAGLYQDKEEKQFIVLTQPAKGALKDIHPRMPILFSTIQEATQFLQNQKLL